jgi:aconitate hydratase
MGALPLVFKPGETWRGLGLDGSEKFSISGIEDMQPRKVLQVNAVKEDGRQIEFEVIARLDTEVDVAYFENNGILPYVLRKVIGQS